MRKGLRMVFRTVLVGFISLLAVLGISGFLYQLVASAADRSKYPPPGQLIDMGGYKLHMYCAGQGSPTIILDSASLDTVSGWVWVQSELARSTRVCAYDRPGLGWSDLGPEPRDADQNAKQLHRLLGLAGEPGPYILVGHSLGGLYARVFAARYPEEVAGIVFIEATHPDFTTRLHLPEAMPNADPGMINAGPAAARLGLFRMVKFVAADANLPQQQQSEQAAYYASSRFADNMVSAVQQFPNLLAQARTARLPQDRPLMVIIGEASENATGENRAMQDEFLLLSTSSQEITIPGADHASLVHQQEHAHLTSAAILKFLQRVQGR